jgi:hypothetical protein
VIAREGEEQEVCQLGAGAGREAAARRWSLDHVLQEQRRAASFVRFDLDRHDPAIGPDGGRSDP